MMEGKWDEYAMDLVLATTFSLVELPPALVDATALLLVLGPPRQ